MKEPRKMNYGMTFGKLFLMSFLVFVLNGQALATTFTNPINNTTLGFAPGFIFIGFDNLPRGALVPPNAFAAQGVVSITQTNPNFGPLGTFQTFGFSGPNAVSTGFSDSFDGTVFIELAKPTNRIGIGILDGRGTDILNIYDKDMVLLESAVLADPGANLAFLGFERETADIRFFEIVMDFAGFDNLIFNPPPDQEIEFVDPVPDLLVGPAVTSDPTKLADMGRVVTGIAAEGAARVVVRVKTGEAGNVEFSLVDGEGEGALPLPASNVNGSLSQVSGDMGSAAVSVPTVDVEDIGPMAFAAYHAPMDFASDPNSKEANDPDRKVFIKVKLTTSTGDTVESTEPLKIVRPPVVLVHGLWESLNDWNAFTPLVSDSNLFVKRANYNFSITGITDSTPEFSPGILAKITTNALGFTFNASFVLGQIIGFIDDFKNSKEVAAIQADLVGHSMGGNVARTMPLISGFFSDKSFGEGAIHKIITLGTPHLGTPLATQLLRNANSCVRDLLAANENIAFRSVTFQGRTFDGGVFELEGDGVGGRLSAALRRLQQPGPRPLPTAMIAGVMSQAQLNGLSGLFSGATFIRLRCGGDPLADSLNAADWPTIFGQDSDAIVPLSSQLNRLQGLRRTAVHSAGTLRFGFRPPHEYQEGSGIPTAVIDLLNTPLTSSSFHLLP